MVEDTLCNEVYVHCADWPDGKKRRRESCESDFEYVQFTWNHMQEDDSPTKRSAYICNIFSSFIIPSLFPLDIIHIVFPKALWSSLMASSTFKVVPALESDMVDISSIFTVSFADDHILGPANGNVAPDLLRAVDLEFMNELWRTRDAFNAKFFKVVDLDTRSEAPNFYSDFSLSFSFFLFFLHVLHFRPTVLCYEKTWSGVIYIYITTYTYIKFH